MLVPPIEVSRITCYSRFIFLTEIESIVNNSILNNFYRLIANQNMMGSKFRKELNRKTTIKENLLIDVISCNLIHHRIIMDL